MTQKLTNNMLSSLASSKLTGTLPALDGSSLTGFSAATKSASDPTISTNPSGGVGTFWANTTSGSVFICTDATAGSNVWKNIGDGSGDVEPFVGSGTTYGWNAGGEGNATSYGSKVIDRFQFSTNTVATDWADLSSPPNDTYGKGQMAGHTSATHGYASAGYEPFTAAIDKFPFATQTNSVGHGNLNSSRMRLMGYQSDTHGYSAGGYLSSWGIVSTIEKFAFAGSGVTTTSHGDLGHNNIASGRNNAGSVSSQTHGYTLSGYALLPSSGNTTEMSKFSFASNTFSSGVGDMTQTKSYMASNIQTTVNGYVAGSIVSGTYSDKIEVVSFTTDGNSTVHASLSEPKYGMTGCSSTTEGFASGGTEGNHDGIGGHWMEVIEKFSFSSLNNVSAHGDLSLSRAHSNGHQV